MRVSLAIFLFIGFTSGAPLEYANHPDIGLDVFQLIEKHGYKYERHGNIQTEDGYILEMHRIPHGIDNEGQKNKPPVLIMHGLTGCSADFVNTGRTNSLAFILADLGYDVWLGNGRGNFYSRNHTILNPDVDKKKFWNYSFNEGGLYDIPAKIDYILETTKAEKLFYIGHSQATTQFFVMASERPEYNDKIRLMTALAPVAYSKNMINPFVRILTKHGESIEWLVRFVGLNEFMPHAGLPSEIGRKACLEESPVKELCKHVFFLICGYDSEQLNSTLIPVISTNTPAGSSTKQFLHYGQTHESGYFRKWDYRSDKKNMEIYGQITPPSYNISKITAPVALHYGQNDWLSAIVDVHKLRDELQNVVLDNKVAYPKFNHIDFLWASDVVELLYNDVIETMKKF